MGNQIGHAAQGIGVGVASYEVAKQSPTLYVVMQLMQLLPFIIFGLIFAVVFWKARASAPATDDRQIKTNV